jgi:hypothetical protein|tara:strand:- start:318 stop:590 length:273 start_codon:yes stop_codon:yes gene_type:complete
VLVDKYDNINSTVDLAGDVGISGARTYFIGVKKLDGESFDKLWKVQTREEYDIQFKNSLQNRQMGNMKYEWWKEDKNETDDVLSGKDGLG